MRSFFTQLSLDVTGFWVSVLCALHCVAVPILLSFAAFGSWAVLEEPSIEYTVLGISTVLGVGSLLTSYFRHHRKLTAIGILIAGFTFIAISRQTDKEILEGMLTATGASLVAWSHVVNFRLCKNYHQES
jgi:hypothetical protein